MTCVSPVSFSSSDNARFFAVPAIERYKMRAWDHVGHPGYLLSKSPEHLQERARETKAVLQVSWHLSFTSCRQQPLRASTCEDESPTAGTSVAWDVGNDLDDRSSPDHAPHSEARSGNPTAGRN